MSRHGVNSQDVGLNMSQHGLGMSQHGFNMSQHGGDGGVPSLKRQDSHTPRKDMIFTSKASSSNLQHLH